MCMSHQDELMTKLDNYNLRVKGDKKRDQVLVKKEVDKYLAKEDHL